MDNDIREGEEAMWSPSEHRDLGGGEREDDAPSDEETLTMWRKLSPEEEKAVESEAGRKREAQAKYAVLRSKIAANLKSSGIEDYELYGAGVRGEELSFLEYRGALRAIGPSDPDKAETFIRIVQKLASDGGYKVDMDRPPSVSHAFGQTIRRKEGVESPIIKGRPILYIYQKYQTFWPTREETDDVGLAGGSAEDVKRSYGTYRFYENRVSQIASEITDDPHGFTPSLHAQVAKQIRYTPEFSVIREEMRDARERLIPIRRSIHMPVQVGDAKFMIYFLAESRYGNTYVDICGCPASVRNNAALILSRAMLA